MSFALKFETHEKGSTRGEVYSCERYNYNLEFKPDSAGECTIPQTQIRMFRSLEDDNPYYETVGPEDPYGACYVMNDQGRTIDVIR